jgi:hypothetical protein
MEAFMRKQVAAWFAVSLSLGVSGCAGCDLNDQLKARAGTGATDCGHVPAEGNPAAVDACVVRSFKAKTPFVASYDQIGDDSKITDGIAGSSAGEVTFLLWDSGANGDKSKEQISGFNCVGPTLSTDNTTQTPTGRMLFACADVSTSSVVCE